MVATATPISSSITPIFSKSMPPLLTSNHIQRERLLALLERGLAQRIMFVTAAEGYGKTTLLREWYQTVNESIGKAFWFNADSHDEDRTRFWSNFFYALHVNDSRSGDKLEPDQTTYMPTEEYLLEKANQLSTYALAHGHVAIIIDNFDALYKTNLACELFDFISMLSPDIHFYLAGRTAYSRQDFKRGELLGRWNITSFELAFTQEDFKSVAAKLLPGGVDATELDQVYTLTEGWPFASLMALEEVSQNEEPLAEYGKRLSGTNLVLNDFFEHEVYRLLDSKSQDFLVKTASISQLNSDLCNYVLQIDDSESILGALAKNNAFVHAVDPQKKSYQSHRLFADWLLAKQSELRVEELRLINGRASKWFNKHGEPIPAAIHEILASDQSDIVELVRAVYDDTLSAAGEIASALRNVDLDQKEQSPQFCLFAAWSYVLSARTKEALFWLEKARQGESKNGGSHSEMIILSGDILKLKCSSLASYSPESIAKGEDLLNAYGNKLNTPLKVMLLTCLAELYEQTGSMDKALQTSRKVTALTDFYSFKYMALINQYNIGCAHFEQGLYKKSIETCRMALVYCPSDFPIYGAFNALLARVETELGETEAAKIHLDAAEEMVLSGRNIDMRLDGAIAKAWYNLSVGRSEQADMELLKATEMLESSFSLVPRGVKPLVYANRALLNLRIGKPLAAEEIKHDFMSQGIQDTAHSLCLWSMVEAITDIQLNRDLEIPQRFEAIRCKASEAGLERIAIESYIEEALYQNCLGKTGRSLRLLHEAIGRCIQDQPIEGFIRRGLPMKALLFEYAGSPTITYLERAYVRRILQRFSVSTGPENSNNAEAFKALFTNRETEIIELLLLGAPREEIAEELCISKSTIKSHLSHMYTKVGVSNLSDFLHHITRSGL